MGSPRFSDELRRAIDNAGLSRYAICKAVDLDQATMSKFMAGQRGLSLATIDSLMDLLGLTIVARPKSKARATREG